MTKQNSDYVERKRAVKKLREFCEEQHDCYHCPFADVLLHNVVACKLANVSSDDGASTGLGLTDFNAGVSMIEIRNLLSMIDKHSDQSAKADYGKEQLTLVPRRIMHDICAIRMYGNQKYPEGGPDNWKRVEKERYRDAAYRHFLAYLDDPQGKDAESGFPHLWHLACNIAFLCEFEDAEREVVDEEDT
jgi:hypothetical protein